MDMAEADRIFERIHYWRPGFAPAQSALAGRSWGHYGCFGSAWRVSVATGTECSLRDHAGNATPVHTAHAVCNFVRYGVGEKFVNALAAPGRNAFSVADPFVSVIGSGQSGVASSDVSGRGKQEEMGAHA